MEKDDIRFTRRIIETNSRSSIALAANVTKSLAVKNEVIERLKKYVNTDNYNDDP